MEKLTQAEEVLPFVVWRSEFGVQDIGTAWVSTVVPPYLVKVEVNIAGEYSADQFHLLIDPMAWRGGLAS